MTSRPLGKGDIIIKDLSHMISSVHSRKLTAWLLEIRTHFWLPVMLCEALSLVLSTVKTNKILGLE